MKWPIREFIFLFVVQCIGLSAAPTLFPSVNHPIAECQHKEISDCFLGAELVGPREAATGFRKAKHAQSVDEEQIRAWAGTRGVPILVIDPDQIDTNRYLGWYTHLAELPVSNVPGGRLVVGDANGNRMTEFYGFDTPGVFPNQLVARIYEMDSLGLGSFRYSYLPFPGTAKSLTDVNEDGRTELVFLADDGTVIRTFTQSTVNSLPTEPLFDFSTETRFSVNTTPVFKDLDGNDKLECLFLTIGVDSSDTVFQPVGRAAVAVYDDSTRNLRRVWLQDIQSYGITNGFPVADFDRDGFMEFGAVEEYAGKVFILEYDGNSSYGLRYEDDTPFTTLYYTAAGDVDGNGWPELFATALEDGNWTMVYEATADNSYRLKRIIHFLAGGAFDEPTFLTADMNDDGRVELVCTGGVGIFVLRSDPDSGYAVWYYSQEIGLNGLAVHDVNFDGRLDLIVSKQREDSLGFLDYYSDVNVSSELTSVCEPTSPSGTSDLYQNYPNPFNGDTFVSFFLKEKSEVLLSVYDLLGRKVLDLLCGELAAGSQKVHWNSVGYPSGVYFCVLRAGGWTRVSKMIVLK